MFIKSIILFVNIPLLTLSVYAQDKIPIEFGHVTSKDFNISNFKIDTTANGVIIADVGNSSFEENDDGSFTIIYKLQRRIKIINKNGFDLGTIEVPLYLKDNKTEQL